MIAQSLLPEYDHEMTTTRSLLALVPDAKATWQPHAKSMTLGKLAIHLATLPGWSKTTLQQTELDIAPPGGSPPVPEVFKTTKEALARFDKEVKEGRLIQKAEPRMEGLETTYH